MKRQRPMLCCALLAALACCSKKDSTPDQEATSQTAAPTAEAPPAAEAPIDAAPAADDQPALAHARWDLYFADFKKAALARDMEALAKVVHTGDQIDQNTFDDFASVYLSDEVLEVLKATEAASLAPADEDGEAVYTLSWSASTVEEGETYESGLYFYFKKIDGQFKLFRLLAAG